MKHVPQWILFLTLEKEDVTGGGKKGMEERRKGYIGLFAMV
jgi:hypothetical protein